MNKEENTIEYMDSNFKFNLIVSKTNKNDNNNY